MKEPFSDVGSTTTLLASALSTSPPIPRISARFPVDEWTNREMMMPPIRCPGHGDNAPTHTGRVGPGVAHEGSRRGGAASQRVAPCSIERRPAAANRPLQPR